MAETNYISRIKTPEGKTYNIKDTNARKRMTEITWSSLVSLRNSKQLIPGMQYRITDYHTTTSKKNTKSADHQFDIIVTADSTDTLNESARAIQHVGDTYFSNCNLAAWKIWYCLDNDTKRFHWAGSTNGKGVIYRMIDEHNNDCPYDFKNIQFIRYYSTSTNSLYRYAYMCWSKDQKGSNGITDVDTTKSKYLYTFSYDNNSSISDASVTLSTVSYYMRNNIIGSTYMNITIDDTNPYSSQYLNNIVLITNNPFSDYFISCRDNKFDQNCYNCTVKDSSMNTFRNECHNICLGETSDQNTFSMKCSDIGLAWNSLGNTFGENCSKIFFKHSANTIFSNNCRSISCGSFINCNVSGLDIIDSGNHIYNNVTIQGATDYYKSIGDLSKYLIPNVEYPQFVGINSSGTIVSYTLDSIINNS